MKRYELDTLIITADAEKEYIFRRFHQVDTRSPRIIFGGAANYNFADPIYLDVVDSLAVKSKAGGYSNMLIHIFQCLKHITERNLQGSVAEFGMYQGGTTVFMAKVLEKFGYSGRIYGFDTFAGFPSKRNSLDLFWDKNIKWQIMVL